MKARTFQWVGIVLIVSAMTWWFTGLGRIFILGYGGTALGVLLALIATWVAVITGERQAGIRDNCFRLALALLACLQVLALVSWVVVYAGVLDEGIRIGRLFLIAVLVVNASAFVLAWFGKGLNRSAGVIVAIATLFVWIMPFSLD